MGVGKTSLAADFEDSLICAFEHGTNALNNVFVQDIKTWSDWKTVVNQLCKKPELKEKFHSIAIDTVDEAWNLCVKQVCSDNGVENLSDVPFGKAYDEAKRKFHQSFRDLTMNGYGLIFISHSTEKTFKAEDGTEYNKIIPALPNRPFDVINKMVDIIAYIREISVQEGSETVRKRFMFLRDTIGDRFMAKSRFRYITPKIELNYNALVQAIYEAIDKECERGKNKPSEAENSAMTLDFNELMQEAKIIWTQIVQKDLAEKASEVLQSIFGKPTKFSEILPEQIELLNQALIEIKNLI